MLGCEVLVLVVTPGVAQLRLMRGNHGFVIFKLFLQRFREQGLSLLFEMPRFIRAS